MGYQILYGNIDEYYDADLVVGCFEEFVSMDNDFERLSQNGTNSVILDQREDRTRYVFPVASIESKHNTLDIDLVLLKAKELHASIIALSIDLFVDESEGAVSLKTIHMLFASVDELDITFHIISKNRIQICEFINEYKALDKRVSIIENVENHDVDMSIKSMNINNISGDVYKSYNILEKDLDTAISNLGESFQEKLFNIIDEKGYKDTDVYKRANIDRKLFSKIRSNKDYQPKKNTAIALSVALHLDIEETREFISRAGFALSPVSKFDIIVEFFIVRGIYDVFTINVALFNHDEPLLGES